MRKKTALILAAVLIVAYAFFSLRSEHTRTASNSETAKPTAPQGADWKILLIRPDDDFYLAHFQAARFGVLAAISELNAAGGLLDRKVSILEQPLPETPVKNQDDAILMALFAGPEIEREKSARWAETSTIPLFLLNDGKCFSASIANPNEVSPYLFNMGLTLQSTLEPLLIHLNEKFSHPDKDFSVYFFGGDTKENQELIRFARSHSEALSFKTIAARFDDIRLADYYSVVRNIIIDSPDVLFLANPERAGQLFLEQAWKLRVDKEMKLASLNSFDSELFPKGTDVLTGAFTASKYTSSISTPENTHFLAELKKLSPPAFVIEGSSAEAAYTSVHLAVKARIKLSKTLAKNISEALADLEWKAPNGPVRMSGKNHVLEQPLFIVQRDAQSWKIVESLGTAVHPGLEGCTSGDGV